MTEPILLSDEEDHNGLSTPLPNLSKKRRTESDSNFPIIVIDDPTPLKPGSGSTPLVVPDTPMSDVSIVKCTGGSLDPQIRVSSSDHKFSGISGMICLESDNDSESGFRRESLKENGRFGGRFDVADNPEWSSRNISSTCSLGNANLTQMSDNDDRDSICSQDNIHQVYDYVEKENVSVEQMGDTVKQKTKNKVNAENKKCANQAMGKNKKTVEERKRLMEEKKLRKEEEKLQKAALKAEAAELKKLQKEKQQWEKGKFALKSIVAEIDSKVVELGSIGGHLLTRFSEKGLTFRITSNPIERSIVWNMNVPEQISQLSLRGSEVPYVLLVYEAEEFCNLINNEALMDHISGVRSRYPSYTICYLTNRLMGYINKRDQGQYKNPSSNNGWRRPPVEEVLAKLSTNFHRVHSRQCIDEAELAEHVVGLTSSLATCQYRKKLTRLSVNASELPKDSVDRNLIKKSLWLKALVAIPKVQPRFAIAIWKKYPTMKSLLRVYMDPSKSVHEKEFLLKDLTIEGLLGNDRRLGEVCSKRVYRVLMAQSGSIKTDDIENGADFFRVNSQNS